MARSKAFILAFILLLSMGCTSDPVPAAPVQEEESAFVRPPDVDGYEGYKFLQGNINTYEATQLRLAMSDGLGVSFGCANFFYGSTNQHAYVWLVCKRSDSTGNLAFDAPVRVRYQNSDTPAMVPAYDISELETPEKDTYEIDVRRLFPEEIQEAVLAGLGDEEKAALVAGIHF